MLIPNFKWTLQLVSHIAALYYLCTFNPIYYEQPSVCQSASQKKLTCQISLSNLKRTLGIVSSECSISYFKCTFDPFYNDRLQLTVAEERIVSFLLRHSTRQLYSKLFSIHNELSRSNPTIIEQWCTNF